MNKGFLAEAFIGNTYINLLIKKLQHLSKFKP
jgi:hypothetical protein